MSASSAIWWYEYKKTIPHYMCSSAACFHSFLDDVTYNKALQHNTSILVKNRLFIGLSDFDLSKPLSRLNNLKLIYYIVYLIPSVSHIIVIVSRQSSKNRKLCFELLIITSLFLVLYESMFGKWSLHSLSISNNLCSYQINEQTIERIYVCMIGKYFFSWEIGKMYSIFLTT